MGSRDVYIDGSCINQGQPHIAKGGIGVYWGPNNEDNKSEAMKGPPTNTGAELQAASRAINIARQRGYKNLRVFTDSETVRTAENLIRERREHHWQKHGDRNNFEMLGRALDNFNGNVEFKHVAAHSGNQHNEAANRMARAGAKEYRTGYY